MADPHISRGALIAGLCALIPLPFLDDWLRRQILRGMFGGLAQRAGCVLDAPTLSALSDDRSSMVLGCLVSAVWWPLRKFFRTVFFFLLVKDCLDWAADAATRGLLVRQALADGRLPGDGKVLRDRMELEIKRHGASPVTRILRRRPAPALAWEGGLMTGAITTLARQGGAGAVLTAFAGPAQPT